MRGSQKKYPVLSKRCETCDGDFLASGKRAPIRRFCAEACRRQSLKNRPISEDRKRICKICGTGFVATFRRERNQWPIYCSIPCLNKGRDRHAMTMKPCSICGKEVRRRVRDESKIVFCGHKCMAIWRTKDAPSTNVQGSVRVWFSRFGRMSACEDCGYDDVPGILILHHKDRNRANNSMDNLKVLCPNCHAIEHLAENKTGWMHVSAKKKLRDAA